MLYESTNNGAIAQNTTLSNMSTTLSISTDKFQYVTAAQIGINSPISFIKSPQKELGNQWVINVGGYKTDNYQSGILIPIYVIVFGLAGGYLRYLYRTSKLRTYVESGLEMQSYLFNWESIPGNMAESNRLKDFLRQNFEI